MTAFRSWEKQEHPNQFSALMHHHIISFILFSSPGLNWFQVSVARSTTFLYTLIIIFRNINLSFPIVHSVASFIFYIGWDKKKKNKKQLAKWNNEHSFPFQWKKITHAIFKSFTFSELQNRIMDQNYGIVLHKCFRNFNVWWWKIEKKLIWNSHFLFFLTIFLFCVASRQVHAPQFEKIQIAGSHC